MRLFALVALRFFSAISGFIAFIASVRLALGVYAVLTVQGSSPDATPSQLGEVHGAFIGVPLILALLFAAFAFGLWRLGGHFRSKPPVQPVAAADCLRQPQS